MNLINRFTAFRSRHPHVMIALFFAYWFIALGIAGEMDIQDKQIIAEVNAK